MTGKFDSICPIFLSRKGRDAFEQIGSGVLIQIKKQLFLLTAAHVIDEMQHGELYLPGEEGFCQIYGHYTYSKIPKGLGRNKDKIDVAYFKLSDEFPKLLHPEFIVLERNNWNVTESVSEGDLYTFAGYPWRKTKAKEDLYSSELFSYSGGVASEKKYVKLGYDLDGHIVIDFNRQKSCNRKGERFIPPHPQGISGGGVFAWPKDMQTCKEMPELHLVGVGHTYDAKRHCLIGTRINYYLANIYQNNPQLIDVPLQDVQDEKSIPFFMGIAWYKKEEWARLKLEFDDGDKMHTTWNEWRTATESTIEHMARKNKIMYPIELEADAIRNYCELHNLPNISRTRIRMVNEFLHANIREIEI